MRLFVIPTHRICIDAVQSIRREIEYFQEHSKEKAVFVLLDNGNISNFNNNEKFLKTYDMPCLTYHIGMDNINNISKFISKSIGKNINDLIVPLSVDYGKIYNLIYIISILLGASGFHRRDSDCQLLSLGINKFPIYEEAGYLNRNVNEMKKSLNVDEDIEYNHKEKICMVGGGYLGDWDLDMKDIVEKNPNALKYLMKICNISVDVLEKQYEQKYGGQDNCENADQPILTSVFDTNHALECGNVSMCELYKFIPNFIGENGVGFDYHTNFVSFECKVPMVYHFNKIYHIHDKKRHKDIKPLNYWMGIIKMVDFDDYHYSMIYNHDFIKLCNNNYGINAINRIYEKALPQILQYRFEKLDRKKRLENIEEITKKILMESQIVEYEKIGHILQMKKEEILKCLDKEYAQSIELQLLWKDIVNILKDVSADNFIIPIHFDN